MGVDGSGVTCPTTYMTAASLTQGFAGNRKIVRRPNRGNDPLDETLAVHRKGAETVARFIIEVGLRNIEFDVIACLFRSFAVQPFAGDEYGLGGGVSRTPGTNVSVEGLSGGLGFSFGLGFVWIGRAAAHILDEGFQRAGGFL